MSEDNPKQPCVQCGHDLEHCTCFVYGDDYESIDIQKHREFNQSQALNEQDRGA